MKKVYKNKALNTPVKSGKTPVFKPSKLYTAEENEKRAFAALKQMVDNHAEAEKRAIMKIPLLFAEYGISDDNQPISWQLLAIKLALHYVRGCQIEGRNDAGRKEEWDLWQFLRLYEAVFLEVSFLPNDKALPKKSIANACKKLAKQEPWKKMGLTGKTLQNRYSEAKNHPLIKRVQKIINENSKHVHGNHRRDYFNAFLAQALNAFLESDPKKISQK